MIFPIGDSPNPRGLPFFTYAIVGLNVALYLLLTVPLGTPVDLADPLLPEYLRIVAANAPPNTPVRELIAQVTNYDLFVFRHAFRPAAPSLSGLFISLFLHANLMHLFGNMLFLWIYGDNVEHRLGSFRFLLGYLGTGIVATLFHAVFSPESPIPLIGASGAISGVLGFYFRWFPHNQVRLLVLIPFFVNVFLVPARLVLGMYLLLDNLLPFLAAPTTEGGGVAYGAHIGGFIAGFAATWFMDRRAIEATPSEYRHAGASAGPPAAAPAALADLVAAGRFADAAELYFSLPQPVARRALAAADLLALAAWLREHGHAKAALTVYQRAARDKRLGPDAAAAHLGAGLVQLEDLGEPTPAYQHFVDALDLDPTPHVAAQARAALDRIAALQKFPLRNHPGRRLRI